MHLRVKICGITTVEAARAASSSGADAVGFIFAFPDSSRCVGVDAARDIARHLHPFVTRVAVFRHPDVAAVSEVVATFCPDVVQAEPSSELVAAVAGRAEFLPVLHDGDDVTDRAVDFAADGAAKPAILLEAAGVGGRGVAPDWHRAAEVAKSCNLILAGGLTPDNVAAAIRAVRPAGVDISSGVESAPGIKDPDMIAEFIAAVRTVERTLDLDPTLETTK
ncbi:MAG: phosphoribosylanthranilate isomerase [Gemmatimonadetes bacterium]|nr:phosphoribosylanthranilate isomerase [Gemmatimonadota bacterium]